MSSFSEHGYQQKITYTVSLGFYWTILLWPWANQVNYLYLGFLICQMGILINTNHKQTNFKGDIGRLWSSFEGYTNNIFSFFPNLVILFYTALSHISNPQQLYEASLTMILIYQRRTGTHRGACCWLAWWPTPTLPCPFEDIWHYWASEPCPLTTM